jgi:GT2 family glycosyltransferase
MKLVVGFIAYNDASAKYLGDFLPSLKAALAFLPLSERQVIAFDNSNSDHNINRLSLEYFIKGNPGELIRISKDKNLGFSRAYNFMIREAKKLKADYFLALNPDTIMEPDALQKLLEKLASDKKIASVSPKILRWDFAKHTKTKQLDSCGLVLKSGLRFKDLGQGELDEGQYNQAQILGPSGAFAMYRLSALEKIKTNHDYFDSRFFMYKEDCDLTYRLNKAGFESRLVAEALVYHDRTVGAFGAGVWGRLSERRRLSRQTRAWSFKNQHLLFVKHFLNEHFISQLIIMGRILTLFIFSLILEQFNLKEYPAIFRSFKA